jgi:uncharacterized protein (TIGR00730 family)
MFKKRSVAPSSTDQEPIVPAPKRPSSSKRGEIVLGGKTCEIHNPEQRIQQWLTRPHAPTTSSLFEGMDGSMSWRIFRILSEFVEGFDFLSKRSKTVTFFGSARCSFASYGYQQAKKLGYLLGKEGFTIITGGAPGVMEAGNWGAYEAGAPSVGLTIQLPHEERKNQYVKESISFQHFFTRKVMLSAAAQAYVYFPGGFGTLDELFEIVTLIQTGKMATKVPIVLVGKKFWTPMFDWIRTEMWDENLFIDKQDIELMQLVDTAEEAYEIIMSAKKEMS